jgi:hypothetical protein
MAFILKRDFATFLPSEAAAITGVSTNTQRLWRKRDFLPENDRSWARFNVYNLADVAVFKALNSAGMTLADAQGWIPFLSAAVVKYALMHPRAVEGPNEMCRLFSPESAASKRSSVIAAPVLVVFANGESTANFSATKALDSATPEQLGGTCHITDLSLIGWMIAERASRPLVRLTQQNI